MLNSFFFLKGRTKREVYKQFITRFDTFYFILLFFKIKSIVFFQLNLLFFFN